MAYVFKNQFLHWKKKLVELPCISNASFPIPDNYGWCFTENTRAFEPGMNQLAPAPESILHLNVCNCRTKSTTNRCECHRNWFDCSEICGCENCENDKYDEVL